MLRANLTLSCYLPTPHKALFSFCQILENAKLLLVLLDHNKVYIYLDRLPTIDVVIQQSRPVKTLTRERLGEDFLFAFDEAKRALAVCASKEVPLYLSSGPKPHLPFAVSCNFTCSLLMRPSKHYRRRGVPSTLPHGIAKL